jgi:hypothetical protein
MMFNTSQVPRKDLVVYYESMKREVQTRPIYECRYDERLETKTEESTHLTYTGLIGELEAGTPKDRDEVNRRDVSECEV